MLKRLLVVAVFGLALLPITILAIEDNCNSLGLDAKISCYENKIKESQGQQQTLSSAITYLDSKISLTLSQIEKTKTDIAALEEEIATLIVKINRLDISLNDISKLLVSRVGASYKRTLFNPSWHLLAVGGLTDYLEQSIYLASAQQNDRKLLLELQNAKDTHEAQKALKEQKQLDLENLQKKLASQNSSLLQQKSAKADLLRQTKNDEKTYQSLLQQAQAQKAAFGRFVSRFGGASILSNQTKCDDWGCYYNQRDGQWGNNLIGLSDSSMAGYGCLVTSMAMIASFYDKDLTPGNIAANATPFFGSTALMLQGSWTVNGVTMTRTRIGSSTANIDNELASGRPVIVGIYGGPDHFLVIKGKENGEYIMNDPFPEGAANVKFTSRYPLSAISSVDKVTVQ